MTQQVLLSQINNREEFEAAVSTHVSALQAFNKSKDKPRPVAHPLVEMCVRRVTYPAITKRPDEYVADYELMDDMIKAEEIGEPEGLVPPPSMTLNEQKMILTQQLRMAEAAAKDAFYPQRKMRLAHLIAQMALETPQDKRTQEQNEAVAAWLNILEGYRAIEIKSAQAEGDIDDLTSDTVGNWLPPTF